MIAEIKDAFSALTEEQQTLVLASYAHELTLVARGGYEAGTEQLLDPALVRRVNEVQHRVTSAIVSRLASSNKRSPDDVLIDIIAGESERDGRRFVSSFRRAWQTALGSELGTSSTA
jgi:hypothetical protein